MLSNKVDKLSLPQSIAIANEADKLKGQGIDIIDLSIGQPDFSPDLSRVDIKNLLNQRSPHLYSSSNGILALRVDIVSLLEKKHCVDYIGLKNIIVTPGAKLGLHYLVESLINPGDSVVLPEPSWLSYVDLIHWSKGEARVIHGRVDKKFLCSIEDILNTVTSTTKAVLINSPVNPTGQIWSIVDIKRLYFELASKNVFLIIDAIYDDFDFYNECFNFSKLDLTSFPQYLVYIHGFSKTFAMPGHRLGYIVANEFLVKALSSVQSNLMTCPNTLSQEIASEMLRSIDVDKFIASQVKIFNDRREFAELFLSENSFEYIPPKGGFYIMLKVDFISFDSIVSAKIILEECHIAVVPGIAYGKSMSEFVRLSLVQSTSDILKALKRILMLKNKFK